MPTEANNFTERITNRPPENTSTIASSALLRIMQESDSLYSDPSSTEWVQKKIDVFKDNLRAIITHKQFPSNSMMHWPDEYARMLREELEYITTCIEYNDKTGNMPIGTTEADLSKPLEEPTTIDESKSFKKVGHIDLSKPDSKPEWDKE